MGDAMTPATVFAVSLAVICEDETQATPAPTQRVEQGRQLRIDIGERGLL